MIDELIRHWIDDQDGPIAVPVEAQKFLASATEQFSAELDAWLHERAASVIAERMGYHLRRQRARGLHRQLHSVFVAPHDADTAELDEILDVRYVVDGGAFKRLRDMTVADLEVAAATYEAAAASNEFEAAFLRRLQWRLAAHGPDARVADAMDPETVLQMRTGEQVA